MGPLSSRPPRPEDPLEGFAVARSLDFFGLPRAAQDRFIASCAGDFDPRPLLAERGGLGGRVYRAVSLGSLGCLVALVLIQLGSLRGTLAIHGPVFSLAYAGLAFGAVVGVNKALIGLLAERALPYRPGIYVFPACVVDARSRHLRVYSMAGAQLAAVGDALRVSVQGNSFTFAGAANREAKVQAEMDRVPVAVAARNPSALTLLDPLYEPPFPSPIGPDAPYALRLPAWAQKPWLTSAIIGAVVGGALILGRNHVSDGLRFRAAAEVGDVESWRAYLAQGTRFTAEVENILLPRAELTEVLKENSATSLVAFRESHAQTGIVKEIDAELRKALLRELEEAKKPGTLAALDEFGKRFSSAPVQALVATELSAAKHAVYARDLAKAKADVKDTKAQAFLDRVFAYIEKHGGKVELRFRRKPATFDRADALVEKSRTYAGAISRPSRYFDAAHQDKREAKLSAEIIDAMDNALSAELVQVERGANIDADARATVPTLVLTHGTEWSSHLYNSRNPLGSFVGIQYVFEVSFLIPDGGDAYTMKMSTFRPAAMDALKTNERGGEERVYETMNDDAAVQFKRKLFTGLFGRK